METPKVIISAFDILLVSSLLFMSYRALTSKSLFQAILFFMIFGLLLAVVWGRLGAFDVAMAEVVIGAGLTGALLLGALSKLEKMGVS